MKRGRGRRRRVRTGMTEFRIAGGLKDVWQKHVLLLLKAVSSSCQQLGTLSSRERAGGRTTANCNQLEVQGGFDQNQIRPNFLPPGSRLALDRHQQTCRLAHHHQQISWTASLKPDEKQRLSPHNPQDLQQTGLQLKQCEKRRLSPQQW